MEIVLAKTAGFCFGVNRAIRMVEDCLEENKDRKVFSHGPVIHNKEVVNELEKKGLKTIEDIAMADRDSIVIIRAHGAAAETYEGLKQKNIEIVDATCPFVKNIHRKAEQSGRDGRKTVIVGDKNHPEVIGIMGWDKNAVVIGSEEEAEDLETLDNACVVAQTTLSMDKWESICDIIRQKQKNVEICNTICSATSERQKEAKEIAGNVDVMIVIGDPNSSNTRKLYELSKIYCFDTFLIENKNQLKKILEKDNIFKYKKQDSGHETELKVGVTAGASTPDRIIKEVIDSMSEVNKPVEEEVSFEELFEKSIRTIEDGQVLKGRIIGITGKEVFVDLGYKADGIIPMDEYSDDPNDKPTDRYKAGDEIEVYVLKVNDGEGNVLLSRKRLEYLKGWDKVSEAYEKGTTVNGVVSEVVNSGVIALFSGIRVFVPASQLSDRHVDDLSQFLRKPITLKIIDFNRQKKKVVGSHKAILQSEREENKKILWEKLEVGQVLKGTVRRLTDFGVFVDIGGIDGLIHISELSWNRIKHPSEVVKEGQELEVSVMDINKEKEKVSLGYKKTMDDPWQKNIKDYEVGKVVKGKVVNLMPFGAFVEIESGLTGLVHISQISNKRINKPQEVLSLGEEVEAKITEIDMEKKKISLSIKEILPVEAGIKTESGKGEAAEEIPDEHKEEMKLTLGDLVSQDSEEAAGAKDEGKEKKESEEPKVEPKVEKDDDGAGKKVKKAKKDEGEKDKEAGAEVEDK